MENFDRTDEDIADKVKVFSSDDEKLKVLGELLSNKASRDIIRLLVEQEMYANEIAKKLGLRPNLVTHHLQKMESIGLLETSKRRLVKNGVEHRFFRIMPNFLISPNYKTEYLYENTLRRLFKKGIKFFSIGFAGIVTWFSIRMLQNQMSISDIYQDWGPGGTGVDWFLIENELWVPIFVVSIVVTGLYFLIIKK